MRGRNLAGFMECNSSVAERESNKLDEIMAALESLSISERATLTQKLLNTSGLNVVLGNSNNYHVSGSIFFQINAIDKETLGSVIDKLDKEAIAKLLSAISEKIVRQSQPS